MTGADENFDPRAIQDKWQARWEELNPFAASEDPADERPRKYALDMFPYPSGDLHMGHAEAYAIGDVSARYWRQHGFNVLHPIGWDSFGLPAENAAIKRDSHPAEWTYANIETQAESFRRYAVSFDWSRRLHTSDPDYYRWNQWLFLRFYERGLAYRRGGQVNWCPNDQTVLANEQVIAGRCERCGALVEKRLLTQWYFKITEYADRLLEDMAGLDWPERVLLMQRNWIGRSEGADVAFQIEGRDGRLQDGGPRGAGHRLHDPPRHAVRRDVLCGRRRRRAGRGDLRARGAGRVRGLPRDGAARVRDRPAGHRPREDRRLPGPLRRQPGQRRADAGLGLGLRPGGVRPRRDHGRPGARPARPGLRPQVRPARTRRRPDRRGRPRRVRRGDPRRGRHDQ